MAITSLIMVRFSKLKNWIAAYELYFADICHTKASEMVLMANSGKFRFPKIKCFTVILFSVKIVIFYG